MSDLRKNCKQGQQKQTLRISSPPLASRSSENPGLFRVKTILKKKFQKWLSWNNSNGERNKVTNFGDASLTSMECKDKYVMPWTN